MLVGHFGKSEAVLEVLDLDISNGFLIVEYHIELKTHICGTFL